MKASTPIGRALPSLRGRLVLSLVLLFLFGAAATAIYQIDLARRDWYDVGDQTMQAQASVLADAVERNPSAPLAALPAHWRAVYARPGSGFGFTIYDGFRRPVTSSPSLRGDNLPLSDLPDPGEPYGAMHLDGPAAMPVLAVRLPYGGHAVVARAGGWNEALIESIEHERMETVLLFILFSVLAVALIAIVLPWALRPLSHASRQAAAIGPNTLNRRIDAEDLPVEVQPLVNGFNGVLDRLAEAYALHRRFTANAAHELRTPLTVLSLRLQHARMGEGLDWPAIIEDLARMQRLLDQLLDLARKQASGLGDGERAEVNMSRIVREAAAMVLPLAEERGRALEVELAEAVTLPNGRADDLRDMARNLIENALLHGVGTVTIDLRRSGDGRVGLTVADQGLSPPEGDALFDEFRKGAESDMGSGLGLAIVRQVAASHGGAARFVPGPTTAVEVVL